MTPVSILCTSSQSAYEGMRGVTTYDKNRDAATFPGDTPVIAHPPCRGWSRHCSHQSKPESGEMDLGLWCAIQVQKCGGVLEQPLGSRLFRAAGLPFPGETNDHGFTLSVCQCWWGYPMLKKTWLYFSRISISDIPPIPFALHASGYDRRREQLMSHRQRSETVPNLARWLVQSARLARR